jgi:hypothetical protein
MFSLLFHSLNISIVRSACQNLLQQKSKVLREKRKEGKVNRLQQANMLCCTQPAVAL